MSNVLRAAIDADVTNKTTSDKVAAPALGARLKDVVNLTAPFVAIGRGTWDPTSPPVGSVPFGPNTLLQLVLAANRLGMTITNQLGVLAQNQAMILLIDGRVNPSFDFSFSTTSYTPTGLTLPVLHYQVVGEFYQPGKLNYVTITCVDATNGGYIITFSAIQ